MSGESEVREALSRIFDADTGIYAQRGFQRRVGFGARPALVHIDLANAWTRPGNAFTCDGMDTIIPAVQKLNEAAARKAFRSSTRRPRTGPRPHSRHGPVARRSRSRCCSAGTPEAVEIDNRIAPEAGDLVIVKKRASGFHGTNLSSYLNAHGVDTVIITGVTMAGCVRHTTEDAIAEGFRPIVVREAVGDRVPGVTEWNLFDIDAKFGDVEPLERVVAYLGGIEAVREPRLRGAQRTPTAETAAISAADAVALECRHRTLDGVELAVAQYRGRPASGTSRASPPPSSGGSAGRPSGSPSACAACARRRSRSRPRPARAPGKRASKSGRASATTLAATARTAGDDNVGSAYSSSVALRMHDAEPDRVRQRELRVDVVDGRELAIAPARRRSGSPG